jgi:fatty-acyl-CoA synthase
MGNLGCTTHGACMVIPAPAFDPLATLEAVAGRALHALYGVPTMFIAELGHPDFAEFDLSSLRTGIMAGSPCPVEVMKQVVTEMHMAEVTICYGMTETSPVSTQTRADDPSSAGVVTVGRVHPHVEVKDRRPGDRADRAARRARRAVHPRLLGDARLLGRPGEDRRGDRRRGWMHTGDLATMDDEGYVNIVGRIKDMVIRGGENVYPREIEEFLYATPTSRRAGDRRARREVRRGAHGLASPARHRHGRSIGSH